MTSDYALAYGSIGALGMMSFGLGFRMSLFRIAGSPGEGDEKSPLMHWWYANQLHAEWAPVGAFLTLALIAKQVKADYVNKLAVVFAAARAIFTVGQINGIEPLLSLGMLPSYAVMVASSVLLIKK